MKKIGPSTGISHNNSDRMKLDLHSQRVTLTEYFSISVRLNHLPASFCCELKRNPAEEFLRFRNEA